MNEFYSDNSDKCAPERLSGRHIYIIDYDLTDHGITKIFHGRLSNHLLFPRLFSFRVD